MTSRRCRTIAGRRSSKRSPRTRSSCSIPSVIALTEIGAKRTAALLEAAMAAGDEEATLSTLDDRFHRVPEDLALYVMRYLARAGE